MTDNSYISEPVFKDKIITLLLKDRAFLRDCSPILTAKDFSVNGGSSKVDRVKATLAELSLEFYEKFNEPLGSLAKTEIKSYAKKNKLPESWRTEAVEIASTFLHKNIKAPQYITEKIVEFKKEQAKKQAITKLIDLQENGDLDDTQWQEICADALLPALHDKLRPVDYFKKLESRISRRKIKKDSRFPVFYIEPLDRRVRGIARGHIGLVLAPYKRGKSLLLLHIAQALMLQRYNVLYFTLEDPIEDVEDRLDAGIGYISIKKLNEMPKTLRERFQRFKRTLRSRLKIIDGTGGGVSVQRIESIIDQERNNGFQADAVIVDYDEEIEPKVRNKDRRFEFDQIYRDMRRAAAKRQVVWWTAAQSKRGTMDQKIVSGDDIAEDLSKIKKAGMALSIGKGDWGDESLYLHVAAHKFDKQHIGCNIISNLDKMRIYDPRLTAQAEATHPVMKRRV